ncbi:hypothetical protein DUNSADRAFT_15936 [Dunaliella salina]|uniref:Secreted protein n=1 Tax=Dunaliella salina TaxID=3046 RepID=A0ABQ7G4P8_DUNSA|nr:hypothetical protein DUNSADRAFT_15936 [Dunaliella salina]|eukprot:KAF5829554.1 hypothetical protein DUNSADRAFT_15936 [Dunaliella salina]
MLQSRQNGVFVAGAFCFCSAYSLFHSSAYKWRAFMTKQVTHPCIVYQIDFLYLYMRGKEHEWEKERLHKCGENTLVCAPLVDRACKLMFMASSC